jgi:multicomponent K+:H+ antiporter subunit G
MRAALFRARRAGNDVPPSLSRTTDSIERDS